MKAAAALLLTVSICMAAIYYIDSLPMPLDYLAAGVAVFGFPTTVSYLFAEEGQRGDIFVGAFMFGNLFFFAILWVVATVLGI